MKIILDEQDNCLRVQATDEELRRIEIDATRRGLSVQQFLQAELDRLAAPYLRKPTP